MSSSLSRLFAAVLGVAVLAGSGCHTGGASTFVGATSMTALALGTAAAERAAGGCIAMCTNGTACNPNNGLCEPMPCRNLCGQSEHCEQTFTGDKCMPGAPTGVESLAKGSIPNVPSVVPVSTPPNSGEPTVVPAAEQQPPSGK
jgi:hypothetical protein